LDPRVLEWAKQVQAISQIGLSHSDNLYDRERYENLQKLAAEMLTATAEPGRETERLRIEEVLRGLSGYPTPKVDVRALVRDGDRVLLIQERVDDRWALPGGWADIGSPPSVNAVREVEEEASCKVAARRLLAVYDRSLHNPPPSVNTVYKLFFSCELIDGEPAPGPETLDAGWFGLDALPPLSTGRVTAAQIERLLYLDDHPELPPDVD
jgi:ADP-ribose pyrophosphatase YjhB (NUDIX family)